MHDWTIYHNPRCSKSRATLTILEEAGIQPQVVRYLETPPDAATVHRLCALLGCRPQELMRTKEAAYSEHVAGKDLDDETLCRIIAEHPILLERPIVVHGDAARLGRPPEQVRDLFER